MPYLILIFLLLLPGCAKPPPPPEPLIDPRIIAAVIQVESAGNPRAIGRKKEIGLMQILPSTGRMLGYSRADLFCPQKNVAAGTEYLEMLLTQFDGDTRRALAGYNCGPAKARRCLGYADRVLKLAYE